MKRIIRADVRSTAPNSHSWRTALKGMAATSILACLTLCLTAVPALLAEEEKKEEKKWEEKNWSERIEFAIRLQFWAASKETDLGGGENEWVDDFLIRRARIVFWADVSDKTRITFQAGQDAIGTKISTEQDFAVKDFFLNYKPYEGLIVTVGLFKIPFFRSKLESGFNQLLVTRTDLANFIPAKEGARDVGGMLWGNRGGFQYRAALFDGSDQDSPVSSLRGTSRVTYNWFTHEPSFGDSGTYLGKERVLQIGAQADFQNDRFAPNDLPAFAGLLRDYHSWAVETFYEEPFSGTWALTFEGAYFEREDDYVDPSVATRTIEGYYGQIGFLLPGKVRPGRLQLAARYEEYDVERAGPVGTIENRVYGINYYGNGHKGKIQFQYSDRSEKPIEIDNDEFLLSVIATF